MKYSFMSFSCPNLNLKQILCVAKLYGYQGIEPRIDAGHQHHIEVTTGKQLLREAKRNAEEEGIDICCIATPCSFANPINSAENLNHAKRAIELAAEVGARKIRVFGGAIPVERKASFGTMVESLTTLAPFAQQNNVTVCVETHDDWCDPAIVRDLMISINHPAIAVNWDIMHPTLSAACSIKSAFEALKPWVRHVHVHDGYWTENELIFKPIGEGRVDHRSAIRLLKDSGYDGFISGEWIDWEPYDVHLPREIMTMKSFE